MVISPEECLKLTAAEEDEVGNIEQDIDNQLRHKFDTITTTVVVSIASLKVSNRALVRVLADYRAAGWDVMPGSGTPPQSLTFKRRAPISNSGYRD